MSQYRKQLAIGGGAFGVLLLAWVVLGSGGNDPVAKSLNLVCVESGKTFTMRTADIKMIPAVNPSTAKRTLLPFVRQDDRNIVVGRYVSLIGEMDISTVFVDRDSHEITSQPISRP